MGAGNSKENLNSFFGNSRKATMSGASKNVSVLLGAQWGDEGKGKIIDYLIERHGVNVTARCQGGNNAGHTVVANGRKYDFHILPSGIISPTCFNVIGNGVVVNLDAFFSELEHNGILSEPGWEKRILISSEAHLVFGVHSQVDGRQEDSLSTQNKIGTTNRGIGPTYSSKCFRNGIRVADLMADFEAFSEKYRRLVEHYKKQFPTIDVNVDEELAKFKRHREKLAELKLVGDTVGFLHEQRAAGKQILIEGANGALLDIDFGTYPYVTSSNSTVGGACTGLGIPPTAISNVIGVVKAYQTRVGTGPFPTELFDETGAKLQQIGKEVGVTTGRKRRCGWIDLFLLRRSAMINGYTAIALTKLDILDTFPTIKVAVGYKLNGEKLTCPPAQANAWEKIEVEYLELEGWQQPTVGVRKYEELPEKCRKYIEFIEDFIKVPIVYIGVGAERESLINDCSFENGMKILEMIDSENKIVDDDKENNDLRSESSISDCTFNSTLNSHRVENQDAQVSKEGVLDLSNLSLTNISNLLKAEYLKVNAQDNHIRKFLATSVNRTLKILNLSNNQIKHAVEFNRFENLAKLDLSCNAIEETFALSLKNLEYLDVSGNNLSEFPDLSKCTKLSTLNISTNRLTNLMNLGHHVCSESLTRLDLSSNQIDDLSQFALLAPFTNLTHIYIANNKCLDEFLVDPSFEVRAYIVACLTEKLEMIDDIEIEDRVRIEGEWLFIQGHVRNIRPGHHRELCEYIATHLPLQADNGPLTPAQKTCHKVLQKRRESGSSQANYSDRTTGSIYSPFSEWNEKARRGTIDQHSERNRSEALAKLNKSIDSIVLDDNQPKRDEFKNTRILPSSIRQCSPPRSQRNWEPAYKNESSSQSTISRTNSIDSTLTVVLSSARAETSISIDDQNQNTPTPSKEMFRSAESESQPLPRGPSVADVSTIDDQHETKQSKLEKRVAFLEEQLMKLVEQNEKLTEKNEGLVDFLENFTRKYESDQEEMKTTLKNVVPTPRNLTFSPLKDEDNTYVLRWEMPVVQGYEIVIDGKHCGQVIGKNNSARITDLDEHSSHTVQIQPIGFGGIRGEKSSILRIGAAAPQ
ncbi:unnamed protein product [Caenorhabditis bovis]|uniref:Adenylosuccinate synthetase n=1 Tax=Caenorhabditis bovis TaxID=2654633 RepID=A0A8S1E854_9PELO|nr:unnamed protein product [Caenorhabditis bovis]